MPPQPTSLRAFLSTARRALAHSAPTSSPGQRIHLVTGNESADLDSVASSLVYAYLRSHERHPTSVYVPILNIPHPDISIRPELLKLLPHAGVAPDDLITVDEVFPSSPSPSSSSQQDGREYALTLVDHNAPTGPFSEFEDNIQGVIDHHIDESVVPVSATTRVITLDAGSCTSLVIQHLRPSWDALSSFAAPSGAANTPDEDQAERRVWDAQVAKLALAAVLVDTSDLGDSNKTFDVDRSAVDYLVQKIEVADAFERGGFFEEIKAAKGVLSSLTVAQVLRRDYKEFKVGDRRLGMSSAVKSLGWIAKKAEEEFGAKAPLAQAVRAFVEERGLDVFAIMTAATHGPEEEFRKEVLVWPRGNLPEGWEERLDRECKLGPLGGAVGMERVENMRAWREHDLSKSRKQVAPLLRRMMEEAQRS